MLEFDWAALAAEEAVLRDLADPAERAERLALLREVRERVEDYNRRAARYEYTSRRQAMLRRGVTLVPLQNAAPIKARWSRLFARSVTPAQKNRAHYQEGRWNLFRFRLLEALEGEAARAAFDRCGKSVVYAFYQEGATAYRVENAQLLRAADFDLERHIYLFDPEERWTYVHTTDTDPWGPYFYSC